MGTLTIRDVREVDDAGDTHYESVMTMGFLVDAVENGHIRLKNNIRFDGEEMLKAKSKLPAKTRRKINKWTEDILAGTASLGNMSIRVDTELPHAVTVEDGQLDLTVEPPPNTAAADLAVDSQSRLMSILEASKHIALFNPNIRCAVRVYVCDKEKAHEIGARYNTEGETVNASAARSASPVSAQDRLASWLLRKSGNLHFGPDNIEVLSTSVSSASHKMCGFYTVSLAIGQEWEDKPVHDVQIAQMGAWISEVWDQLVAVRPEFGLTSISTRRTYRDTSIAGSALGMYGAFAVLYGCYAKGLSPEDSKVYLDKLAGEDWVSKSNPEWQRIGVLTEATLKDGSTVLRSRNSFQSRKAIADAFRERVGL